MPTFSIRLDPDISGRPGTSYGRIVAGDLDEQFEILPLPGSTLAQTADRWRHQLQRLVDGVSVVALVTQPGWAWVLYREPDAVHIQEQLYGVPNWRGATSTSGDVLALPPREVHNQGGEPLSDWTTSVEAIRSFLEEGVSNRGEGY